jgi:hypothetical protein
VIYAVLLVFFKPSLLFSQTTTAGGDTGAHHYDAMLMIKEYLPHFRLTGWAQGWYAGMPMFTFYWPFPFLLIAIFNWVLPYTVAFKIVTVLGVFAMPPAAYAMARLWRVRKPFPTLAAIMGLAFVFMVYKPDNIYGGNILSTLAGEFGYMLSFALVFLFLGTLHRGMQSPRLNMLFVLNCLILMAIALSHLVTTMALVAILPGLLLVNLRWRSLAYMVMVGLVGFALTAFWSIPFLADLQYTASALWHQNSFKYLFPWTLLPAGIFGILGIAYAISRKERKLLPLAWMTVVIIVLYELLPEGRLWNMRVAPFFWASVYIWAAYGATWLIRPFIVFVRDLFWAPRSVSKRFYVPLVAVIVGIVIVATSSTAASWISWNYTGYEGKPTYSEYQKIMNYLNTLPQGRVMEEHSSDINEFGTERAFEVIPYWTKQYTMEGTLMEASITAPFHFINLAELSKDPGGGGATLGLDAVSQNVSLGITHLQLMNISYFITTTDEITAQFKQDSRAQLLATFSTSTDTYNIFSIAGTSGYVEVMQNEPVRLKVSSMKEWRDLNIKWYQNESSLKTPIVRDQGEPALQKFKSITASQVTTATSTPINIEGHVTNEKITAEGLSFDTTAIGQPHWVKISYFPNWHVKGAEGPYLVSPSLMMVIPTQSHVELYYGRTNANNLGQALTGAAFALLIGVSIWRIILWRRRRRLSTTASDVVAPRPEPQTFQETPSDNGHDLVGPAESEQE